MDNFTWTNPTKVVFGQGTIPMVRELVPKTGTIMMLYGGGSIKRNGVYTAVIKALKGRKVVEFGGIEPNPRYETCMLAVQAARKAKAAFLLAVGGGSVGDATKFIAAALKYKGRDPWDILAKNARIIEAVPLGCILTLPATGTESNPNAVISRESTQEKLPFSSDLTRPVFAILDPETTYSLDRRQTANGVIDSFVHVCEQYLTYPNAAPVQDRQAEALLLSLIEIGPRVLRLPKNYAARADLMYAANQALNLHLSMGVPSDWATHLIGHELTALYGIDHGASLAIVQPGVWTFDKKRKAKKLLQYAERVWGIADGSADARIRAAIDKTEKFYHSLGVKTTLKAYGAGPDAPALVRKRLADRGASGLGEHGDLDPAKVEKILQLRLK
ncbi:MAG: iron-containing alcohol dehydrogenase [Planctomycetes bacterium]|nr:iron-containing alcohol dehydrogenase [Planctomycetota bacterium]